MRDLAQVLATIQELTEREAHGEAIDHELARRRRGHPCRRRRDAASEQRFEQ